MPSKNCRFALALATIAIAGHARHVAAAPELGEVNPPASAAANAQFGAAVSVAGDRMLVGAPFDDTDVVDGGAARVYRYDMGSWVLDATLPCPDPPAPRTGFGYTVSLSSTPLGTVAVVGAPGRNVSGFMRAGKVYVYRLSGGTWSWERTLTELDCVGPLGTNNNFGSAVATNGRTLVIGAIRNGWPNPGAAYIAEHDGSTWNGVGPLVPSDVQTPGDYFGASVDIDDDPLVPDIPMVIVGAPHHQHGSVMTGAAYVFTKASATAPWQQEYEALPDDGAHGDEFGASVAIASCGGFASSQVAAVGARWHRLSSCTPGTFTDGAVYTYTTDAHSWAPPTGGVIRSKMTSGCGGRYGSAVSMNYVGTVPLSHLYLAVGKEMGDFSQPQSGIAFLYDAGGLLLLDTLWATDGGTLDFFGGSAYGGQAIDIDGTRVVVGAPAHGHGLVTSRMGGAYVY